MKVRNRKAFIWILAALTLLSSVGCSDVTFYNGSHPELFVVAAHSLLGVRGGSGEDTLILEEDGFGRVMFAYIGHTIASDNWSLYNVVAVLIAQRTTEGHSYFYPGVNFILREIELSPPMLTPIGDFFYEDFVRGLFTERRMELLKEENSWNGELNEERLFRVTVSRRNKRRYMTQVSADVQQAVYTAVAGAQLGHISHSVPLTMDKNGNIIFFMRGLHHRGSERIRHPAFLVMFNVEGGRTGHMRLTDLWDYREQLREFKEAHGWSFYHS